MSRLSQDLNDNFIALCQLRDELALRIELLETRMRERWVMLEAELEALREHLRRIENVAESQRQPVEAAARNLMASLKAAYLSIRNSLKS